MTQLHVFRPVKAKWMTELEQAAWPLFNDLWEVQLMQQDIYSNEEIKRHGMSTTGDDEIDRSMRGMRTYVMIKIDDMVRLLDKAAPFSLSRQEDTVHVFNKITRYLLLWKNYLEQGVNLGGAPIPDLILLDKLAERVFPFAAQYLTLNGGSLQTSLNTLLVGSDGKSRSIFDTSSWLTPAAREMDRSTYKPMTPYFESMRV